MAKIKQGQIFPCLQYMEKKTTELPYYLRKNIHTKSLRYNLPSYTLHLYSDVNEKDLNTETVPVVR